MIAIGVKNCNQHSIYWLYNYNQVEDFMSRVMTYLSKKDHDRFTKVCEREECTPYMLFKKAVLDHIWAYPLEKAAPSGNGVLKKDLEDTQIETPKPEPAPVGTEEISESVRRILEGKED